MENILEKLWNEYFADECATIDTDKEKELASKALKIHKIANESLTKEQYDIIEKYIDTLCEIQNNFVKKAFFKGCEFSVSFLLEARELKKYKNTF